MFTVSIGKGAEKFELEPWREVQKKPGFFEKLFGFFKLIKKQGQKKPGFEKVGEGKFSIFSEKKAPISETKPAVQRKVVSNFFQDVLSAIRRKLDFGGKARAVVQKAKSFDEKNRRRTAAISAWRERKERAEKLLRELERLKEKEKQVRLSQEDVLREKSIESQLYHVKHELEKVSSNFESAKLSEPKTLQIILGEISKHESLDEQIDFYKSLQKRLEIDFYKRRLSEEEFRRSFLAYADKIRELSLRKEIESKKSPVVESPVSKTQSGNFTVSVEGGNIGAIRQNVSSPAENVGINIGSGISVARPSAENIVRPIKPVESFESKQQIQNQTPNETNQIGMIQQKQKQFSAKQKIADVPQNQPAANFSKSQVQDSVKAAESFVQGSPTRIQSSAIEGSAVNGGKLLDKMGRLVDLMEEEHKAKLESVSTVVPDKMDFSVTKIVKTGTFEGIETEISRQKIVSDFDKLLELVIEKGAVKDAEAMALLNFQKKRFDECCSVLEQNGLIKLEYPIFGGTILKDVNFVESKNGVKKNG